MINNEILTKLNLSEKESLIYLASLQLGEANISSIAKKSGVQRTHVYDLAAKLTENGLLRRVAKGNKVLFAPVDPDHLVQAEEKKLAELKRALPEFKTLYNTSGHKPKISFYEGQSGINWINEDSLNYKGEILAFTTPKFTSSTNYNLGNKYIKDRIALGNKARIIGENSPEIKSLQDRDRLELRETKILSSDIYNSNVEIGIYGNKTFVIDYKENFGFIIESSEIAKTMKMIFEITWNKWQ